MKHSARSAASTEPKIRAWLSATIVTLLFVILIQLALVPLTRSWAHSDLIPQTRIMLQVTAIALVEFAILALTAVHLRRHGRSLTELGLRRPGTTLAWLLAIALGFLTAAAGLSNPALHLGSKIKAILDPSPWHLYSALLAGLAAGVCEETLFRGFIMAELAGSGYGRTVQVIGSAFFFGLAHAGLLRAGFLAALLVIVPTAILGALYSVITILGRRSLLPAIVSHFINDFAVIPWVFLALAGAHR